MDRLILSSIRFHGRHGVLPEERAVGWAFEADVELECDLSAAAQSDRLAEGIDYSAVRSAVLEVAFGPSCRLIEALAERMAAHLLGRFPVVGVTVRVRKITPSGMPETAWAGVEITRRRP